MLHAPVGFPGGSCTTRVCLPARVYRGVLGIALFWDKKGGAPAVLVNLFLRCKFNAANGSVPGGPAPPWFDGFPPLGLTGVPSRGSSPGRRRSLVPPPPAFDFDLMGWGFNQCSINSVSQSFNAQSIQSVNLGGGILAEWWIIEVVERPSAVQKWTSPHSPPVW